MSNDTTTPRTDACPHCGAEVEAAFPSMGEDQFKCGSWSRCVENDRTELCREREARQKAEIEVERLNANLAEVTNHREEANGQLVKFKIYIIELQQKLTRAIEIADDLNNLCVRKIWHNHERIRLNDKLSALRANIQQANSLQPKPLTASPQ